MPIFAFTGEDDPIYSPKLNENMVNQINAKGGHAKHFIMKGIGHGGFKDAHKILQQNNWPYGFSKKSL